MHTRDFSRLSLVFAGVDRATSTATDVAAMTLLERLMPEYDAERVERRTIGAPPHVVYDAAIHADFLDAVRQHRGVRGLFALRTALEKLVTALRRRAWVEPPPPARLRLKDLPTRGEWILLGADPPREIAFGVIGRFWAGETTWLPIGQADFATFAGPGFAKIACALLLHELPDGSTLLSYAVRTRATDERSRRAFRRYWRLTSVFIGIVMRSFLAVVARDVRRLPTPPSVV